MTTTRLLIALGGAAAVAALGVWWYGAHVAAHQGAQPAPAPASALVATQMTARRALPQTLDTYGEIATGKPDSLGFAQAGQITALPLVAGQRVRRGELLARLASDPNAVSAYSQAANAAGFARRELTRQQQLFDLQLSTQTQVDSARKALEDAQAAVTAQARLGGARASAELRAPYDAVVMTLAAGQGDRVAAGATVVQVGRLDRLRALLALEPSRSVQVKPGMPVSIAPVSSGSGNLDARIASAGDLVDPKSQMVTAVAELPDAGGACWIAGTRVQATIRVGQRDAWIVPRQAVLSDAQGDFLYQVRAGKAHRVNVAKVGETGQSYGVDGQLDAALPVVVLGNYELSEGMAVREGRYEEKR